MTFASYIFKRSFLEELIPLIKCPTFGVYNNTVSLIVTKLIKIVYTLN